MQPKSIWFESPPGRIDGKSEAVSSGKGQLSGQFMDPEASWVRYSVWDCDCDIVLQLSQEVKRGYVLPSGGLYHHEQAMVKRCRRLFCSICRAEDAHGIELRWGDAWDHDLGNLQGWEVLEKDSARTYPLLEGEPCSVKTLTESEGIGQGSTFIALEWTAKTVAMRDYIPDDAAKAKWGEAKCQPVMQDDELEVLDDTDPLWSLVKDRGVEIYLPKCILGDERMDPEWEIELHDLKTREKRVLDRNALPVSRQAIHIRYLCAIPTRETSDRLRRVCRWRALRLTMSGRIRRVMILGSYIQVRYRVHSKRADRLRRTE